MAMLMLFPAVNQRKGRSNQVHKPVRSSHTGTIWGMNLKPSHYRFMKNGLTPGRKDLHRKIGTLPGFTG